MIKEMTLMDCLDTLSKEKIDELYKKYSIYFEKKQKNETLESKKKIIIDGIQKVFQMMYVFLTSEEEKMIDNIIKGKEVTHVTDNLLDILHVFEVKDSAKTKYIIPKEIADKYNDPELGLLKQEKDLTIVSFYIEANGVLSLDKLLELVKETGIIVSKSKIKEYIEAEGFILENNLVYYNLLPKQLNIYNKRIDYDYKVFSIEEIYFLKFNDLAQKNEKHLCQLLEKYTEKANAFCRMLIDMVRVGYNFVELINDLLKDENIKLSKSDEEEFDKIINMIYFTTPNWELNGYVPTELMNVHLKDKIKFDYIYAYILINGIMPVDKLLELCEKEHDIKITKKELKEIVNSHDLKIYKDCIVVDGITNEIFNTLMMLKKLNTEYKIIDDTETIFEEDRENIIKISEICKKYNIGQEIQEIMYSGMSFGSFNKLFMEEVLKSFNVNMSAPEKNNLYKELNSVFSIVRLWPLNGFKRSELYNNKKSTKIGRNEKCPCGSGKKYKQCCGK